ncbi:MAG TPA: hypothetical protein PLZ95_21155, partial [Bryobacteraceae bacterium]|nr:hypothetical protein [Bryobacteraceae bacterium]
MAGAGDAESGSSELEAKTRRGQPIFAVVATGFGYGGGGREGFWVFRERFEVGEEGFEADGGWDVG